MNDKRRALGRGLGALIPSATSGDGNRPADLLFGRRPVAVAERPGDREPDREDAASDAVATTWDDPLTGRGNRSVATDLGSDHGVRSGVVPAETTPAEWNGPAGSQSPGSRATDHTLTDARAAADEWATIPSDVSTEGLRPVPGARYAELDPAEIRPNPRQPRQVFDEDELAELVHSIQEIGVLQPIVVRPVGTDATADGDGAAGKAGPAGETPVRYELVMGERRWRAAREAGLARVPAIVKDTQDDALLRDALLENLHRSQLNPLEEAAAYQQLLDDFGCTHDELAARIGRSRPQISNTIRLLKLPPLVARRVAAGVLSAGHARALLALPDGAAMERMAQRIVAEGLSVRSVEEIVALGGMDETPTRRARQPRRTSPELADLAAALSDHLDTRVAIDLGQRKGKVTVEFASIEDLHRILDVWGFDRNTD